eukprot:CAMPEP_0197533796 /NCGR_PEP_ID=MMETSP1318-20131121/44707_1 /TAXON_ID=552666 /ORGANISM="Partenskyella glossopodia, Strain RCC365" /LENGTH=371 /DNA_ID=CAMNT_0043090809 /DNA_START=129 /DNA_END=1241 /DNA_ORIENTATION=+
MVFMGGKVSGAHYNPAVTLAVALCGKISWTPACFYMVSQVSASFLAGLVGGIVAKAEGIKAGYPSVAQHRQLSALLCEILFTFILAKVVLNVAGHSKRTNNAFFGLAIGLTVFAGALSVGDISGGAFNPAVGTGLTICQGSFWDIWIYWLGPMLGGGLAAFFFWTTNGEEFLFAKYTPPSLNAKLKAFAPYVMEGIGTFFLTFVVSQAGGELLGAFAIGAILVALVFMGGHVSGSHFNPAVTCAMYSNGSMDLKSAGLYILSQFSGALLAAAVSRLLDGWRMGYPTVPGGSVSIPAAVLMEMLFSFALVLVVLQTAVAGLGSGGENSYYGLAIGMTVFAGAASAGGISGGCFNPAIGVMLPLMVGEFYYMW